MADLYSYAMTVPMVEDYLRLRAAAGLSHRSEIAARAGLPGTVAGVVVHHAGRAVGMGRAIGDGLFYQIVDIAVEPEHQGHGLGKGIMARLMNALRQHAPAEAYVSLLADGRANELYAQFGFAPSAPSAIGMAQWIGR